MIPKIRLKLHALDSYEIENAARKLRYFRGVFPADKLPQKPRIYESGIVNLEDSYKSGSHWTAYFKLGRLVLFFDSFALPPTNNLIKYFAKYTIFFNRTLIQKPNDFICGHLALQFLYSIENKLIDNRTKLIW